mmetsp:Transcript_48060/g.104909  ORF Transcript_48060/g.104909 Transcript_48060/m.104909 type:complete len:216 (-) Transcript_48060:115-762(-)
MAPLDDTTTPAVGPQPRTLYGVLGVAEDAHPETVTRAYRQKARTEHPDKGGDKDRFDELAAAYRVLEDAKKREAYDEELIKQRDRVELVEDGARHPATFSEKQAQAPMRAKTEPHAGSTRQGKMRTSQPGKPQCCAQEWKGLGSGASMLKMLTDDITPEQKTERLMDKYAQLPRGKEKKREWVSGLRGKEKQDLKRLAKEREAAEMAKWQKWLAK